MRVGQHPVEAKDHCRYRHKYENYLSMGLDLIDLKKGLHPIKKACILIGSEQPATPSFQGAAPVDPPRARGAVGAMPAGVKTRINASWTRSQHVAGNRQDGLKPG